MKKCILFLIVGLIFIGCATAPAPVEKLQSQVIFEFSGVKKDKIFNKTVQWIAENFVSANSIIQYKDLNEGKIICQITTSTYAAMYLTNLTFRTTMTIEIKDGKSRITLLPYSMSADGKPAGPIPDYESNIDYAKESYKNTLSGYKEYVFGNTTKSKDNW